MMFRGRGGAGLGGGGLAGGVRVWVAGRIVGILDDGFVAG